MGQTEHNNTVDVLETNDARTDRWKVKMAGGQVLALKPHNVRFVFASGRYSGKTHTTLQSDEAVALPLLSSTHESTTDVAGLSNKFAMDIKALVMFGIDLFESNLEEQLGPADADILRVMYVEHCLDHDVKEPYYTENIGMTTCPELEFGAVVGQDGIDRKQGQWQVKSDTEPTLYPGAMVEVRNVKTIKDLMKAAETKKARLLNVEMVALRLASGPQHVKYDSVRSIL